MTSENTINRISIALAAMLSGQEPQVVTVELNDNVQIRELASIVNKLADQQKCLIAAIDKMTEGDFSESIDCGNAVAERIKALQVSLRNLS